MRRGRARIRDAALVTFALAAAAVAATGWMRTPARPRAAITITDVRPLKVSEPTMHELASHFFAVRVAVSGWSLLPYQFGRPSYVRGGGHWRLYLDGYRLGESYGGSRVTYTPYLIPGTHWIAAELTNPDSSSLSPPIWSEPVVLHVPRRIRCWQTGWHGSSETGTPIFGCGTPAQQLRTPAG
jgi:hypothetical protein